MSDVLPALRGLRALIRLLATPPEEDGTPQDPLGDSDAPPWALPEPVPPEVPAPPEPLPEPPPAPPECPSPEGLPVSYVVAGVAAMRAHLADPPPTWALAGAVIRAIQEYGAEVHSFPRIGPATPVTGPEDVEAILSDALGYACPVEACEAFVGVLLAFGAFTAPE